MRLNQRAYVAIKIGLDTNRFKPQFKNDIGFELRTEDPNRTEAYSLRLVAFRARSAASWIAYRDGRSAEHMLWTHVELLCELRAPGIELLPLRGSKPQEASPAKAL